MQKSTLAKIGLTAAVVVGGASFMIAQSVSHAQHYKMVDDLVSGPLDDWKDKEMKVHGWVEAGSIVEKVVDQEDHRTFILQKGGKKIRVFFTGPTPDTFKDQSEVVATGRLVPSSSMQAMADSLCKNPKPGTACPVRTDAEQPFVVESSELMAKCPSKYDGATSNKLDTKFK